MSFYLTPIGLQARKKWGPLGRSYLE